MDCLEPPSDASSAHFHNSRLAQDNYTAYAGNSSFLAGPTDNTKKLWSELEKMIATEVSHAHRRLVRCWQQPKKCGFQVSCICMRQANFRASQQQHPGQGPTTTMDRRHHQHQSPSLASSLPTPRSRRA